MSKIFSLRDLHELDRGKANVAINHALRQIAQDVMDRPGDKAKRKVVVTIEMVPTLDKDTASLDTVETRIQVKTSVPVRQTEFYPMLPLADGRLTFEPLSPFDPRQKALFDGPVPGSEQVVNRETGEVTGGGAEGEQDGDDEVEKI